MPWGLTRFHHSGQSHFVTFCCYNRPSLVYNRRKLPNLRVRVGASGGLAHPLRHPAEAAPPFAVFEGWELGISGAKLLQKDRSIRVQGNEIIYLTLGPWTKPVQILVKPPAHLVFG